MKNLLDEARTDQAVEDLTEQALLLVLIALASVNAMNGLASAVQTIYNYPPSDPAITA